MKDTHDAWRLAELIPVLESYVTDYGYQGICQAEREAATVFDALQMAIRDGTTEGLARAVSQWQESQPPKYPPVHG